MPQVLKWIGIILSALAGLLIFVIMVVNLIPGEQYKSLISSWVKSTTGRELFIEGALDISLTRSFAFKASGIKLSNAEWGSRPDMVSVERIEGEVPLFPLLGGILDVTLVVDNPDLHLETHDSGQGNWQFGDLAEEAVKTEPKGPDAVKETKSNGGLPIRLRISKLHLNGMRIVYSGGKDGNQFKLQGEKLHVGTSEEELSIELKGIFNDIPLALSGGFDNAEFLTENQPSGVKLDGHVGEIKLVVQGTAGPLWPNFDLDATLGVNAHSVADFSPLTGQKLPNIGPLTVSAKLVGRGGEYAIRNFATSVDDKILSARIKGSIAELATLDGLQFEAEVVTTQLTEILKSLGIQSKYPLPDMLNSSVVAEGNLKKLSLREFKTKIQGQGLNINSTAEVKNVIALEGIFGEASLETQSLDLLSEIIKTQLPPIGPLKVNINFASKGEKLSLLEIKADLEGEALHMDLAGSVADPLKLKGVDADLNLSVDSLGWLGDYLNIALPPNGSLTASAQIASKGDSFQVNDFKAALDDEKIKAKVAASVEDLLQLVGINVDINVVVDSLAALNPLLKHELPASDPVTLEGKILSKGGLDASTEFSTKIKTEGVTANFTGSIAKPLAAKGINLELLVEADSMQHVSKLMGAQFQGQEPVKLESKFITGDNSYELTDLHLMVGELDIKGRATFNPPLETDSRPRISGDLHVGKLDLTIQPNDTDSYLEQELKLEGENEETKDTGSVKKKKIFSSKPLPFGPLKTVDADIVVTIASLTTLDFQLEEVVANLKLDNGLLRLDPMRARVGNGTFAGSANLDTTNSPPTLAADIELANATFRNFGGKVNSQVDLNGSGDSVASIMAGLDGHLAFNVREATLKKSFMTGFGEGLINSLNPFDKDEENTELTCAVILFDIAGGVADADRKIAAQMTDVTWFGSGEINLKTEEIDFGMNPKGRKGLDISLGRLATMVHIGGTLAQPKIELDPKEMVTKYGEYSAAVATGGITLAVRMLWDKIKANTDVCADIMDKLDSDVVK